MQGQFTRENVVLARLLLEPLKVNDTTRPVSVILHSGLESINVTLRESIRDPNGRIVNTNEFSKTSLLHSSPI